MALPKALLCSLGDYPADAEEQMLRKAGFATGSVSWKSLAKETNDWMQIGEILEDEAIQAWVIAGEPADFTCEIVSCASLLALSLRRATQPGTAFVQCEEGTMPVLPPVLQHVKIYHPLEPFAARLMAARFKPGHKVETAFSLRSILDPYVGIWLEAGPADGLVQSDFTVGVLNAEILAFGVGPKGQIPAKSHMAYPVLGVQGTLGDRKFSACAAKNEINAQSACYCKIGGIPQGVFLGNYLDEDMQNQDVQLVRFV